MTQDATREALVAQTEVTRRILSAGSYRTERGVVDLRESLESCRAGTQLVKAAEWDRIAHLAQTSCIHRSQAPIKVTPESTLAALERLTAEGQLGVAALNFASALRPGGGWDVGSRAQEESLARASGLVPCLMEVPEYYAANREADQLFYTDNAIWSPAVPFFARDDGSLLARPYTADIITMPAPNLTGRIRLTAQDLRALRGVWLGRIRNVLALAIAQRVRHLILGAWGCGAFGNDPILVARCFREVLNPAEPWLHGLETVTFAVLDDSRHSSCLTAFSTALNPPEAFP